MPMRRRATDRLPDGTMPPSEPDTSPEGLLRTLTDEVVGLRKEVANTTSDGREVEQVTQQRFHGATRGDLLIEIVKAEGDYVQMREQRNVWLERSRLLDTLLDDIVAFARQETDKTVVDDGRMQHIVDLIGERRSKIGGGP